LTRGGARKALVWPQQGPYRNSGEVFGIDGTFASFDVI
jgi:hypothetical protein